MAYRVRIECAKCGETKEEMVRSGNPKPAVCSECVQKEAQHERDSYLAELQALPLPERLARLEAWAYDFEKKWSGVLEQSSHAQTRF